MSLVLDFTGSNLQPARFSILTAIAQEMGLRVVTLREKLEIPGDAAAVFVFPKREWVLSPLELKTLRSYVMRGGFLVVLAEGDGVQEGVARLLQQFGIFLRPGKVADALTVSEESCFDHEHPAVKGIERLHFIAPCSARVLRRPYIRILVRAPGDNPVPLVVVAKHGSGNVAFIASAEMFADDMIRQDHNGQFIANLLSWALKAKKVNVAEILAKLGEKPAQVEVVEQAPPQPKPEVAPPSPVVPEKPPEEKVERLGVAAISPGVLEAVVRRVVASEVERLLAPVFSEIQYVKRYVESQISEVRKELRELRAFVQSVASRPVQQAQVGLPKELWDYLSAIHQGIQQLQASFNMLYSYLVESGAPRSTEAAELPPDIDTILREISNRLSDLTSTTNALQDWLASLTSEIAKLPPLLSSQSGVRDSVQQIHNVLLTLSNSVQTIFNNVSRLAELLGHLEELFLSSLKENLEMLRQILRELQELRKMLASLEKK